MKPDDAKKLLGGYATGTLTEEERQALFAAALDDQQLFDALADDDALRAYLEEPSFRRELATALEPPRRSWFQAPAIWGLAGSVAAGVVLFVALHQPPAAEPVQQAAIPKAAAPPAATQPAPLLKKLAVVDSNSPEAKPKLAQSVSKLVNDRLASGGVYNVVNPKEVDRAVKKQEGSNRTLNATEAANIGRAVGADAVVTVDVTAAQPASVDVTARMVDTKTGQNFALARAKSAPGKNADSLKSAAASIGSQLEQARAQGLITAVDGETATIAMEGVKVGESLVVKRNGEPIGSLRIVTAGDGAATGKYSGDTPAKAGDAVAAR